MKTWESTHLSSDNSCYISADCVWRLESQLIHLVTTVATLVLTVYEDLTNQLTFRWPIQWGVQPCPTGWYPTPGRSSWWSAQHTGCLGEQSISHELLTFYFFLKPHEVRIYGKSLIFLQNNNFTCNGLDTKHGHFPVVKDKSWLFHSS